MINFYLDTMSYEKIKVKHRLEVSDKNFEKVYQYHLLFLSPTS